MAGNSLVYAQVDWGAKAKNREKIVSEDNSDFPPCRDSDLIYTAVNKSKGSRKPQSDKSFQGYCDTNECRESGLNYAVNTSQGSRRPQSTKFVQGYMEEEALCHAHKTTDANMEDNPKPYHFWTNHHLGVWPKTWSQFLVPGLVLLSLILLIVIITLAATCEKEQRSNGSNRNAQGKELLYDKGPYALCPMNWILIRKKCYFFSENKKNQSDSKKNCTDSGARLATTSATESNLQRFIRMTSQDYWVGLENLGTHHQGGDWTGKWSDGRTEKITKGIGSCAKMGEQLMLENCFAQFYWICETDPI